MSDLPVIETASLTRHFGPKIAVDDVSLSVARGEIYGFLGPNGAGKTTTIRLMLGLLEPTRGEVRVLGAPVRRGHAQLNQVGAVIERPGLYPHLTAAENLIVFARVSGIKLAASDCSAALDAAGLDPAERTIVRRHSTGMRQRLALALAMIGRPQLLILDEPTEGLDPVGIVDVRTTIVSLAEQGITVFLSSHLLSEVERICTRVGILVGGRLTREVTREEIRTGTTQWVIGFEDGEAASEAARHLSARGLSATPGPGPNEASVSGTGVDASSIASALAGVGLAPKRISPRTRTLEELFLDLADERRMR
jgi:ABC-2 type transport system ATP-binding protein